VEDVGDMRGADSLLLVPSPQGTDERPFIERLELRKIIVHSGPLLWA
jgi:hypothetical protein